LGLWTRRRKKGKYAANNVVPGKRRGREEKKGRANPARKEARLSGPAGFLERRRRKKEKTVMKLNEKRGGAKESIRGIKKKKKNAGARG